MDSSGKVKKMQSAGPVYKTVTQLNQRKRKSNDFFSDDGNKGGNDTGYYSGTII